MTEVLDRAAKHSVGPSSMPQAVYVGPTSAVVVRRGSAALEAAEFRRDSAKGSWSLYQILIRPDGHELRSEAVDFSSLTVEGVGALERAEKHREMIRQMKADRSEQLERLLSSWRDASRQRGMAEYAALAWAYADEARRGNAKATAAVAEKTGSSPAVAAQRIKEARKRGLLTPGQQGRASGEVTRLGTLYTRPGFEGFAALRREGDSVKRLARRFRLSEAEVGAALAGEGHPELAADAPASGEEEHENGGGA